MKKFIINSKGVEYSVNDRVLSHNHVADDNLLIEALSLIDFMSIQQFDVIEVNMGRCVGTSDCVEINDGDIVEWKVRPPRNYPSKMVYNREAIKTNSITVVLKRTGLFEFVLITAYVGTKAPRETFDPMATYEDIQFWENHALRIECLNDNK